MTNKQVNDLKKFIITAITESEARTGVRISRLEIKIDNNINDLRKEMNDGFLAIGDTLMQMNNHIDIRFNQVDKRLTALEDTRQIV